MVVLTSIFVCAAFVEVLVRVNGPTQAVMGLQPDLRLG